MIYIQLSRKGKGRFFGANHLMCLHPAHEKIELLKRAKRRKN
jgi:hypothetical protein